MKVLPPYLQAPPSIRDQEAQQLEKSYREARECVGEAGCQNIYCPFCDGLVWSPVPYTQGHFVSCPHYPRTSSAVAIRAAQKVP